MQTIIIFYKYIHLDNPQRIMAWQKGLCQKLHLKGRIILAHEGINGTLGGSPDHINTYKHHMQAHPLFSDIDFKESYNTGDHFPRLRVVVKTEIVNLGLDPQAITATQAGIRLEPAQAHELIAKSPEDLLIIDCRNYAESAIGTMQGAVRPPVNHFRDFPAYVDRNINLFKNKQVLMYCTGGVRCERASAYIKTKQIAKEVYHIKGGIHRYIEQFPQGFFRGKNYVFDGRTAVKVTDDILGNCFICQTPSDEYTNCLRAECNKHFICCTPCKTTYGNTCSSTCYKLIITHKAACRPTPVKVYSSHEKPNL